jgi:hypothetical protein
MALLSHDRVCAEYKFVFFFVNINKYIYIHNVNKFICIVSSLVHKPLNNEGNKIITLDTAFQELAFCNLVKEVPVLW